MSAPVSLPSRRGVAISVAVPKGGAGKSSLALNLGVYLGLRLREAGRTVCVVDANFQQADVGKYINVYRPNIVNLVQAKEDICAERIGRHLLVRPDLNTAFLLGPVDHNEANPLWITPQLYCQVIEVLRHLYDYIIIDTPVAEFHHPMFSEFILPQSDFILVPVAPNIATVMNTDNWLRGITAPALTGGAGVDPDRVGIVLNRAEDDIGFDEAEIRANLANWHFLGTIPESKEIKRAANRDEIVATRNFAELNAAFNRILYAITGEEELTGDSAVSGAGATRSKGSIFSFFKNKKKKS